MEQQERDEMIQLELPATFKFLKIVGCCIQALLERVEQLDEQERKALAYNVELAAYETCTNIVEHAYGGAGGGRIKLSFRLGPKRASLIIDIRDTGKAFDLGAKDLGLPSVEQLRGYGLYLVHQLMDEVSYTSRSDGNEWSLVKYLTGTPAIS